MLKCERAQYVLWCCSFSCVFLVVIKRHFTPLYECHFLICNYTDLVMEEVTLSALIHRCYYTVEPFCKTTQDTRQKVAFVSR